MPYQVTLLEKKTIARGTMSFTFEKPDGYSFKAGQATDWSLIDPSETDAEGTSRSFSIAIAPSETTVRLATRMRDTAFKRQLGKMEPGSKIQMDDPWGEFTLPEGGSPLVFLCGGIGITPFLSILEEAQRTNDPRSMTLIYSNKRPDDVPFREELQRLTYVDGPRKMIETMTEVKGTDWRGEQGFIDWQMIMRRVKNPLSAHYMIAGPPLMVAAMKNMLTNDKVEATQIVVDDFLGY